MVGAHGFFGNYDGIIFSGKWANNLRGETGAQLGMKRSKFDECFAFKHMSVRACYRTNVEKFCFEYFVWEGAKGEVHFVAKR